MIGSILPDEVVTRVIRQLDRHTLEKSVVDIPQLRRLCTLKITDQETCFEKSSIVNVVTIQRVIQEKLDLDKLFEGYHFFEIEIHSIDDYNKYLKIYKVLARLIKLKKVLNIRFICDSIDLNYLKMFKSLFHHYNNDIINGFQNNHHGSALQNNWFTIVFENLKEIKSNCNHLLISSQVSYPMLKSLNLYYCSPKFYFEVLNYLNLNKFPKTFPKVTYVKFRDYMSEEEDTYSMHSNNYIKNRDDDDDVMDDYDDYDNNSDLDENEFFFDGLEIISNYKLSKLEVLIIKNCNVSKINKIYAPKLETLKIFEISNKHADAYDLNLIDSSSNVQRSFISSAVSTQCSIQANHFPYLKTLKIIGHLNLKDFSKNSLDLDEIQQVIIKGCNVEIIDKDTFWENYHSNNQISLEVL
ncbi:hypothetical protein BN7_2899 [Wickerhamomyces ciferrii]|uniref:Uncharacterized protein n=1 Tax=Wickerhamomyces ciferrii (strain ATCC 14091 / BCRC 22168 / CBS 111 / JCM 3599 / NBRC 0793 / NRRL Y-1031 F-60-10) TaxID=1206466 RepID=K0KK88_WICCF|nr:uncharacterized protein BN7_2899 [Wickerhamomyces ciferrii]CCH43351.1 hypothetical protein BN7_2899 [Wickerhamomyces ciferrii]